MPENTTNGKTKTPAPLPICPDLAKKITDSLSNSLRSVYHACDIMTRDIKVLTLDNTVRDFLAFMKKNEVRHVAVFDPPTEDESKPFFVGIVSERDVLRLIHPYADKNISVAKHSKTLGKPLVQIVTRNPISVSPDTPVDELISIMIDNSINMLPVFEETELVGIITTTDILRFILTFEAVAGEISKSLKKTPDNDSTDFDALAAWVNNPTDSVMTSDLHCLSLEDTLEKAIGMLRGNTIRHILVIDKNIKLVGIVSDRDVLRHLPHAKTRHYHKQRPSRSDIFYVEPDTLELQAPLAHIMTWEPVFINDDFSVAGAAEKFYNEKLSCLPVLNAGKNLNGIVTVTDLMKVLRKALISQKNV